MALTGRYVLVSINLTVAFWALERGRSMHDFGLYEGGLTLLVVGFIFLFVAPIFFRKMAGLAGRDNGEIFSTVRTMRILGLVMIVLGISIPVFRAIFMG